MSWIRNSEIHSVAFIGTGIVGKWEKTMKAELSGVLNWSDRFLQVIVARSILQAGAICLRERNGQSQPEVLLITSRSNGGWGIPKGHIEPGETSRDTAQREAFEEAGVMGFAGKQPVGFFSYGKNKNGRYQQYAVVVHLLSVQELAVEFPEKGDRVSKWVPVAAAGDGISYDGLRRIFAAGISR